MVPNQLIIRIQPTEGVYLRFNAKKPGQSNDIIPVKMDFCQNCEIGYNSPEAYERLLYDAMKGEKTLFTRWDEVEYSWKFVDAIQKAWQSELRSFPTIRQLPMDQKRLTGCWNETAGSGGTRDDGRRLIGNRNSTVRFIRRFDSSIHEEIR